MRQTADARTCSSASTEFKQLGRGWLSEEQTDNQIIMSRLREGKSASVIRFFTALSISLNGSRVNGSKVSENITMRDNALRWVLLCIRMNSLQHWYTERAYKLTGLGGMWNRTLYIHKTVTRCLHLRWKRQLLDFHFSLFTIFNVKV